MRKFSYFLLGLLLIAVVVGTVAIHNLVVPLGTLFGYSSYEPTERGGLIDYEKVGTISEADIEDIFPEAEMTITFVADITIYRLFYSSIYKGEPVVLSGLLLIPQIDEPLSHYQYHHGTMIPSFSAEGEGMWDAPSYYDGAGPYMLANHYETRYLGVIPAGRGYMVSMPDYVGYGSSRGVEHTYAYHPELATASVDMILAARALAEELEIELNDDLFLAGWSEGGGATLATHKMIEAEYEELTLTASAPFAGPYNMHRFLSAVVSLDDHEALAIYNWAIYSLNEFSGMDFAAEEIWVYEVDGQMDSLQIPEPNAAEIFTEQFISLVQNGGNEALDEAVEGNTLHEGWAPEAVVFFHSGREDDIVFHFNTIDAFNGLQAEGGNVRLREYDGNHDSPVNEYIQSMLADFEALRE